MTTPKRCEEFGFDEIIEPGLFEQNDPDFDDCVDNSKVGDEEDEDGK